MSIDIISRRTHRTSTEYRRSFEYRGERGCGFSFESDEHGNVDLDALNPCARKSYLACLDGVVNDQPIADCGVETFEHRWTEPAVGRCICGAEVMLDGWTCPCECGRDYNSSGQLLAPREQWGEETGETLSEILSIR